MLVNQSRAVLMNQPLEFAWATSKQQVLVVPVSGISSASFGTPSEVGFCDPRVS